MVKGQCQARMGVETQHAVGLVSSW